MKKTYMVYFDMTLRGRMTVQAQSEKEAELYVRDEAVVPELVGHCDEPDIDIEEVEEVTAPEPAAPPPPPTTTEP